MKQKPQALSPIVDVSGRPYAAASGYRGGQYDADMLSWSPALRSADAELLPDMKTMVARSYDLQRNNSFSAGGIQIHKDNIVGAGLRLSAKPDYRLLGQDADWAAEWSKNTEAEFRNFCNDPGCYIDAGRRNWFGGLLLLGTTQYLASGEILATSEWLPGRGGPYSTAIQMVEPARLSNPHDVMDANLLRGGVAMDNMSAAHTYHIRSALQSDARFTGAKTYEWTEVSRETTWGRQQVIHIFEQERAGQTRGKTGMASVIANSFKLGKFKDASLESAIINSMYAAVMRTDLDYARAAETLGAEDLVPYQQEIQGMAKEFYGDTAVKAGGAKVLRLMAGDDFQFTTPQHPGPNFADFEDSFLHELAAGWNLTYEQLSRNYTKTNYSGARAGLQETWKFFTSRRELIVGRFASAIYALWLEEAIDKGVIELPPGAPDFYDAKHAYCNARWIGPGKGAIDPLKEAKADELEQDMGTLTFEDACANRGKDWEEQLDQIAREKQAREDRGLTRADVRGYMTPEVAVSE